MMGKLGPYRDESCSGISPHASSSSGKYAIYFNDDSISFNNESSTDQDNYSSFRRYFEVYIDESGKTFTHERGRINKNGTNLTVNGVTLLSDSISSKINILSISPKLRGNQFGSVNKITLQLASISNNELVCTLGDFSTEIGKEVIGLKGSIIRVYDKTNIDYIDILLDIDTDISSLSGGQRVDIQLFPSLFFDKEFMMIATCQLEDNNIKYLRDERQFGNISESDLSSSALAFISATDSALHSNGVVKGFELTAREGINPSNNIIYLNGGSALVNGKLIQKNYEKIAIPAIIEKYNGDYYNIRWLLCLNNRGDYVTIPLLDYDPNIIQ
jgi:hypothetical protein